MQRGDTGQPVQDFQEGLAFLGIPMIGNDGKTYGPDGSFGSATVNGANKFKASVGLPQDGIVDAATWGKMLDALRAHAAKDVSACEAIKTAQAALLTTLRSELDTAKAKISAVANIIGQ